MKKRILASLLVFLMIGNLGTAYAETQLNNPVPEIIGTAGALIDTKSGQFMYGKNENQRMFPASTTKILTTLIALEKGKLDDPVRITEEPTKAGGSRVYLQQGETLTLEQLLYCVMLNSANDAAVAVAVHIGGSVEGFAKLMNEKARELGAVDSNFTNPNGLPDTNHYTTAHDLALISRAAMNNAKFREIVAAKTIDINRIPKDALTRLINHNKLLWRFEGANGIKTGYTVAAQQCLVGSAKRNGREVIAVVLGSVGQGIWKDVTKLLNYGFDNFQTITIVERGKQIQRVDISGSDNSVQAVTANDFSYVNDKKIPNRPEMQVKITKGLHAPISKGSKIGQLIFSMDGAELGRVDLLAASSVATPVSSRNWGSWSLAACAVLAALLGARIFSGARRKRVRSRRIRVYKENY